MARGVNKVILIGHLGADPETRYTADQRAICNIRMATTRAWRDKRTNELHEETEWHRVVMFGRTAEVAHEYLAKGSQCYIEGRLQTRKWQDQSGADRWSTEVIAEDLQLLGGRGENQNQGRGGGGRPLQPPPGQQHHHQGHGPAPTGDFEDDIPF